MNHDVAAMLTTPGFYVALDPKAPNAIVPLVVVDGAVFSMKSDSQLDPERFFDRTIIHQLMDVSSFKPITDAMYRALKAALPDYKIGAIMGDPECRKVGEQIMIAMKSYQQKFMVPEDKV